MHREVACPLSGAQTGGVLAINGARQALRWQISELALIPTRS